MKRQNIEVFLEEWNEYVNSVCLSRLLFFLLFYRSLFVKCSLYFIIETLNEAYIHTMRLIFSGAEYCLIKKKN